MSTQKVCRTCNILKDISDFHKNSCTSNGHLNECKDCKSIKQKMNYEKSHLKYLYDQLTSKSSIEKIKIIHQDYDTLILKLTTPSSSEIDASPGLIFLNSKCRISPQCVSTFSRVISFLRYFFRNFSNDKHQMKETFLKS